MEKRGKGALIARLRPLFAVVSEERPYGSDERLGQFVGPSWLGG